MVLAARVTPAELAEELAVDPKRVRRWLRETWPRGTGTAGRRDVTPEQAGLARVRFAPDERDVPPSPSPSGTAAPQVHDDDDYQVGWSSWRPLLEAADDAPRTPGVYVARQGPDGPVVYVGMAGERRGKGVRGRLRVYTSGKGMVSGLGEAALDRALSDPAFLRDRLALLETYGPERSMSWGRAALERADLWVRWAATDDRASAVALELAVIRGLRDQDLWNRNR